MTFGALQLGLIALQSAIESGNFEEAATQLEVLKAKAVEAGYGPDSDLMLLLNSLESEGLANRATPFTPEEMAAWNEFFVEMDKALNIQSEMYSGISPEEQTALNSYSAHYRQGVQLISHGMARWDKAVANAVANLKA